MTDKHRVGEYVCSVCSVGYNQQDRLYRKAVWRDRCPRHRRLAALCQDCGAELTERSAVRCKTCSNKSRATPPKFCVDCGAAISKRAKRRCLPCHNRHQDRGLSRERTKFNASDAWRVVRVKCFERDDYACRHCGVRGGVELNAHHIQSWRSTPLRRLDLSNLVTLCRPCHMEIHHRATA